MKTEEATAGSKDGLLARSHLMFGQEANYICDAFEKPKLFGTNTKVNSYC